MMSKRNTYQLNRVIALFLVLGIFTIMVGVVQAGTPKVNSTTPADGATEVPVGQNVVVVLNKTMNTSVTPTLTQTAGTVVSYSLTGWSTTTITNDTATWTHPDWYGDNITLQVSGANDTDGNTMETYSWSFTTADIIPPAITFVSPTPADNATLSGDYAYINVSVVDTASNVDTALLEWNGSNYTMTKVGTGASVSFYRNMTGLADGTYTYKVHANDSHGNMNVSGTRTLTYTVNTPNLNLTPQNITFVYDSGERADVTETGDAKEGINLTINATIYNQGTAESDSFYVLFYDGNSEFYNVSMDNISAGGSANATGYWTTLTGTHNITIKVDPYNNTQDSDPGNNNASKLIDVSAWGKYYGNVSGIAVLADSAANSMLDWTWSNETNSGYVYVVKKDVSINWSALHPLGYDKNNNLNASGQDFLDADINLGMIAGTNNATGFTGNNITELFTNTLGNNYGNISINLTSSIVHGRSISNVPIVNSTDMTDHTQVGSASFITGILWDDTRDTNGYFDTYDKEDLVFIANIRQDATGLNGAVHNYEIAIPCALNSITAGDVEFYMELK